jgi:phospho-N-acetylmuramoyl-pentapeptide-transferase
VTDLLLAGGIALLVAMLGTPLLINWLRAQGIGQQIREDGPELHLTKAGTPTMGGVAIIGAAVTGYLVEHVEGTFTTRGLVAMLAVCATAGLGLIDDWIKVHHQRSLGLNKRAKIAGQLVVALTFAILCVTWLKVDTHLSFTRYNSLGIDLGQVGWVIFAVLVIVGCSNAVNLTDGLDGLAAGSSIFSLRPSRSSASTSCATSPSTATPPPWTRRPWPRP